MSGFPRKSRFCQSAIFVVLSSFILSIGLLLTGPASTADYPPAGSEISSLQEAYNQANDTDTIRTKTTIFSESLVLDRPIAVNLNGGYSDTTYSSTDGFTSLYGTLTVNSGAIYISNFVIGGGTGGITISNVAVTIPRIDWTTDQPASSRVDYGETTSYGMSVTGSDLTTYHSLVLTGLKPNTTYHYIVSSSTSAASAATADSSFTTPDFIAATIADVGNSAVIEVAGGFDTTNPDGSINVIPRRMVAQEYYKTHSDNIDFLVMFSTFDYAMPDQDTQGVYTAVKNDTLGINQVIFDNSALYGSSSKLQGTIDMGNTSPLAINPYGELLDQTLTVLSHELAHRFGAFVRYKLPDNSLSTALLGKDNSHWSYLLDSQGSVMYGNGWIDNGDGTFISSTIRNAYSPLDLYLMGMITVEQVPPMLLIDNTAIDATQLPFLGATVSGTATTVVIDDIVAAEGERIPSSATSPKQFNIGFVLLTRSGDSMGQAAQALDVVRKGFAGRFAELTQGIGSIANVPASLEVVIDTPASGATITGPSVQVTGAVINTTGVETGVTVNGIPATVSNGRFIANAVDLQQGINTITATATDVNALISTATRTVTAQTGNYIRIKPNIESGISPLDISLTVDSSFTISSTTLLYSGPVAISQLPGSTPTNYLVRLPAEGAYTLKVQSIGPDLLTYEDLVIITVFSKNKLDNLLRNKWLTVNTHLSNGNTASALTHFISIMRPKYQAVFDEVVPLLPTILATYQELAGVSMDSEITKYELTTLEDGSLHAFDIVFVKDDDGIWRIRSY